MIRIPLFVFLSFLVIFSDPGYGNDRYSGTPEIRETSAGTFRLHMPDGTIYRLRQRKSTGRFIIFDEYDEPIGSIRQSSTGRYRIDWD